MLSLKTVIKRERIPFELEDGRIIYFRTKADFDIPEMAMSQELSQRSTKLQAESEKAKTDAQRAQNSVRNQAWARDMIHLGLPDLPDDVLNGLTPGQIDNLARLCRNIVTSVYQTSLAELEQRAEIAAEFPELPEAFIVTLSRAQAWLLIPPPGTEDKPEKN